jgi:hypothetical protein
MIVDCHCRTGKGEGFRGSWDTEGKIEPYLAGPRRWTSAVRWFSRCSTATTSPLTLGCRRPLRRERPNLGCQEARVIVLPDGGSGSPC